jgi:transcriptional regulator GlxA family with amidase domain
MDRNALIDVREPVEVGFVLAPGFSLLSYACAIEPLRAANVLSQRSLYRWWHAAPGDQPVQASNGVTIVPNRVMTATRAEPNILFVCAGGNPSTFSNRHTFAWLRRLARLGTTMGGISGGPYILAKAGLLAGRRCTLHWEHISSFQETFPDIRVTRSLFEIDGDRITCSGGIAALDMMVVLIERTYGRDLAKSVSEWFVHTQLREGPGSQRMDPRFRHGTADQKVLQALGTMEKNIERPLPREKLAKAAGTSLRSLERAFRRQLGNGLHRHYLSLRLAQSRKLLQETSLSVLDVALATGFASASQFSRAYRRQFGRSPKAMRSIR